jgi:hypothetical protein
VPTERPLHLDLVLQPERRTTPADVADVPQTVDDSLRLILRIQATDLEVLDSRDLAYTLWDMARVDATESPLTVRRVEFGSPFHILTEIPWQIVTGGLLWGFLGQVERFWSLPGRIRVESARLLAEEQRHERELWEQRLAALQAEEAYWIYRRGSSGRHLQGPPEPPAFLGIEGRLADAPDEAEPLSDDPSGASRD